MTCNRGRGWIRVFLCRIGLHGSPTVAHCQDIWYGGRFMFREWYRSCCFCDERLVDDGQKWAEGIEV